MLSHDGMTATFKTAFEEKLSSKYVWLIRADGVRNGLAATDRLFLPGYKICIT